ncbi:IclR family transcriptional regulator [Paracoccus aestuarii]|uniref:IclR family transcriptional regulator n=1 Tax=Paracoccus aestuarii TaxID=453842 RepID=A0A418ZUH7_9RHOB|nr:IclR family transcriptional regulator [Paracoccus aestuarii]RJL02892.1 IclR family transcriptional regulator [Paracoccus aestuarii]WCQ98955.1 IclR family transcriptional regulator [Paracoccus aestuarii]
MTPPEARPDYEDDRNFATTLARGLSVLRAFRTDDDGLSNAQIAERTGLPKSTVSRLTFTLGCLGYLTQPQRNDRYRPGPTLLAMGHVAAASLSFLDPAQGMMQALADQTGTLVLFAVRDRDKVALMRTWRPQRAASIWLDVGHRLPIGGSSSGMAVLGASTTEELACLMADHPDPALDGRPLDALRLEARDQLIAQGYALVRNELRHTRHISAVSVPFRSARLAGPVAFSCGALDDVLPEARIHDEVGPLLRDSVRRLQQLVGADARPAWPASPND